MNTHADSRDSRALPGEGVSRRSIAGPRELVAREVDGFERSIARFREGLVPEPVFIEERLRLGVYGQRQDGVHMMRSKLPLGLMTAEQVDAFADVAERFGNGVAHLTTRQDIQVHFVKLDATPDLLRALDRAEMTSREACGNVVRNVTAAPLAGVDPQEVFDVTPYGMALARFALRHPDGQSLGRKFKIHLSGSSDPRWNLGGFHDFALTAKVRVNGHAVRGFEVRVGGGLGAVPYEAPVFADFVPEGEVLPLLQAILRVFALHGEKENRARARVKFLVAAWGIERFREEVLRVREGLDFDPRWLGHEAEFDAWTDAPLHAPAADGAWPLPEDCEEETWLRSNVLPQKQAGYGAVHVRVPRGDLSPAQLRGIAALMREHSGDTLRITPDQALVLRFVPLDRLLALRRALQPLGLAEPRAGGLGDTVTCPGADSCKLGITSPRSLARAIQPQLDALAADKRLESLRIRVSGCPNSCAQHQVADIGFFGAARNAGGMAAPHYMLLLGGLPGGIGGSEPGESFALPVTKIPASRVGDAVERIARHWQAEGSGESFGAFVRRIGRARWKELLDDLTALPSFAEAPDMYREPGREDSFAVARGKGECEGEMVDQSDLLLATADREAEAAVDALERGEHPELLRSSLDAVTAAARALLAADGVFEQDPDRVEAAFRARFYETGRIFEGFGHYYLEARGEAAQAGAAGPAPGPAPDADRLRRRAVEAGLFVEEAHSLLLKLRGQVAFPRATPAMKDELAARGFPVRGGAATDGGTAGDGPVESP